MNHFSFTCLPQSALAIKMDAKVNTKTKTAMDCANWKSLQIHLVLLAWRMVFDIKWQKLKFNFFSTITGYFQVAVRKVWIWSGPFGWINNTRGTKKLATSPSYKWKNKIFHQSCNFPGKKATYVHTCTFFLVSWHHWVSSNCRFQIRLDQNQKLAENDALLIIKIYVL